MIAHTARCLLPAADWNQTMPISILRISFALLLLPFAGQTPNEDLLVAARKGDLPAVRALLERGADVNAKTAYGATPLSYASDKGHVEVVRLLLERGADPNAKDTFYGATPISWAAGNKHAEIVRLLLKHGAKGAAEALMAGARQGHAGLVEAVLDHGGLAPEALTPALAAAMRGKHDGIAELLRKAGAQPPKPEFVVDAATLQSYAGTYRSATGDLIFAVRDGKLAGGPPGQNTTMGATDKVTFFPLEFPNNTITFEMEGEKVVGIKVKNGDTITQYKRVEDKK